MGTVIAFLDGLSPKFYLYLGVVMMVLYVGYRIENYGYSRGANHVQAQWDADKKEYTAVVEKVVAKEVTIYKDRVKFVKDTSNAIKTAVPLVDDGIVLGGRYRVLHDSAAKGVTPTKPDGAIAAAFPISAATFGRTVADNYATCHVTEERLIALQNVVRGIFNIQGE